MFKEANYGDENSEINFGLIWLQSEQTHFTDYQLFKHFLRLPTVHLSTMKYN